MDAGFEDKLRAAVSAGWRVLLIEVGFLTLVWLIYLTVMPSHPAALIALWGPEVSWSTVATVTLQAIAMFKVAVWLQAGLLLWAAIWAVRLRNRGEVSAHGRTGSAIADEPEGGREAEPPEHNSGRTTS